MLLAPACDHGFGSLDSLPCDSRGERCSLSSYCCPELCRGERLCFDNAFYECGYGGGGLTWSTVYSDHACVVQPLSEWCGSLSEWSAPPPPPDPQALNALRLGAGVSLRGTVTITLASSTDTDATPCSPTPSDTRGPFHIPPETVPDDFPERQTACDGASNHSFGLPLLLRGEIRSSSCAPLRGEGVIIDIWQADPSGAYWDADGLWRRHRHRRLSGEPHPYNCRAHLSGGEFAFESVVPGHYVAGSAWRPRHLHFRARAPGHRELISQLYFPGDPLLGPADAACQGCNSDNPALIVALNISSTAAPSTPWSMAQLPATARRMQALSQLGETCDGFDERTGAPFPSCAPGLVCMSTGMISIPGAGYKCQSGSTRLGGDVSPPYLRLWDNLDEPEGNGFCLDLRGFRPPRYDDMQAHSCKVGRAGGIVGADQRFRLTSEGEIEVLYDTQTRRCLTAPGVGGGGTIDAPACDGIPRQRFCLVGGQMVVGDGSGRCLAVGDTSRPANSYWARDLAFVACSSVSEERRRWEYVDEAGAVLREGPSGPSCSGRETLTTPRQYVPVGKVCRPKNNDGYKIWSGVDTPESCQAKCEAEADVCGAWEYENHSFDNKECELHEASVVSVEQTRAQGECELTEGGALGYRCCWVATETASSHAGADWAGCTAKDRCGDFNGVNNFTIGDALYVAQMWAGKVPRTACMGGDFDQRNGFTISDAVYVAQVWSGHERFPWEGAMPPAPPHLSPSPPPPPRPALDYGFPRCYTGFSNYDTAWINPTAHFEVRPLEGFAKRPYEGASASECDAVEAPLIALGPHWSPLGLVRYEPSSPRNALPERYHGALLVASHGSWNRDPWIGYSVNAYTLDWGTYDVSSQEVLVPPLRQRQGSMRIRPVDLLPSPVDGSLLMTADRDDWVEGTRGGALYRVVYGAAPGDVDTASVIDVTAISGLHVGNDAAFQLERLAALPCARQMARSTTSATLLYVSTFDGFCPASAGGAIYVVELDAASGRVARTATLARGLHDPQGIDTDGSSLFIATGGSSDNAATRGSCVLRISDVDALAQLALDGAAPIEPIDSRIESVTCGFTRVQRSHSWRSLRVVPGGTHAVVSVGADCNWDPGCANDGQGDLQTTLVYVDLESGEVTIAARGIRNAIGLFFDPSGNLLFTSFGSDWAAGIPGATSHNNVPEDVVEVLRR